MTPHTMEPVFTDEATTCPALDDAQLAGGVARLMGAVYRSTIQGASEPGKAGRVGVARLHKLATFPDEAVEAAVESGFVEWSGSWLRMTRLGRSIFDPVQVEATTPGDLGDVVGLLASMKTISAGVESMAARFSLDPDATWQALADAERNGLVERWADDPDGPSVALTPLGASRLGLRPSRDSTRWLSRGEVEPEERVRQAFEADEDGHVHGYDDQADPAPSSLDSLVAVDQAHGSARLRHWEMEQVRERGDVVRAKRKAEVLDLRSRHATERRELEAELSRLAPSYREWERRRKELRARQADERIALGEVRTHWALETDAEPDPDGGISILCFCDDETPTPLVLVGLRVIWPTQRNLDGSCGGCGGRELKRREACLVCHRSGVDHLCQPLPPMISEARKPTPATPAKSKAPKPKAATSAGWDQTAAELRAMREGRKRQAEPVALRGGIG